MRIKVNGCIPGYTPGQVVEVPADATGIPLDLQWRRRLRDAKIDHCCEVVEPPKRPAKPRPEE